MIRMIIKFFDWMFRYELPDIMEVENDEVSQEMA
jgi:hypothetical protein